MGKQGPSRSAETKEARNRDERGEERTETERQRDRIRPEKGCRERGMSL